MRVVLKRLLHLVWPRESLHTGSMTTGLMAHSRMAKAKANSRALLHICTALFQLVLGKEMHNHPLNELQTDGSQSKGHVYTVLWEGCQRIYWYPQLHIKVCSTWLAEGVSPRHTLVCNTGLRLGSEFYKHLLFLSSVTCVSAVTHGQQQVLFFLPKK